MKRKRPFNMYTYGLEFDKFPIPALQKSIGKRMIARMNNEIIKRYSLVEIALLLIFAMGLFFAYLIVKVRHRIVLSEPIELAGSGLAVSMPSNPGWEYEKNWRYESDNSMMLVAQQAIQPNRRISVQWRYDICSPAGTGEEILRQRIERAGHTMDRIESIEEPVQMLYALVNAPDSDVPFYLGVAELDYGRHLELQIFADQPFDIAYSADGLFMTLARGIRYSPPAVLHEGKQLTAAFWDDLQDGALSLDDKEDESFLIKTANNRPFGYYLKQFSTITAGSQANLQIQARQYEYAVSLIDSTFWFDGDQRRFNWETTEQKTGMGSPRQYTLVQGSDGQVRLSTNFQEDKQFIAEGLLLPELLLPEYAAFFMRSERERVVVDVAAYAGFVVPTILEKAAVGSARAQSEQIEFVVKINFLHDRNSFEELYYDENRRFIGRYERQPLRQYLWELTPADQLEGIFEDNFRPLNGTMAAGGSV